MSEYIVSARKYRPLTFDSVIGQHGLTTTLKNAIATGRLAHAYLFCGPRGVGKTTSARIFAKTINCLSPTPEGDACGQCESCLAFDERRSFNIHELDAASNNSVEDIRNLIDEVRIPPQVGRYKVFIIDEVHMLSQSAFNAFLKTLEEPPSHVVFILATTEKHKILPTILSRCQVYDFNRITVEDTVAHLRTVAEKEGYTCDDEALAVIAEKADGGMRDALSIFDQVAAFTGGDITYDKVVAHLGVLNTSYYFQLVDHLLAREIPQCMVLLNEVLSKGFDAGLFINGLATHLRNVMMSRDASTLPLLECSESMRTRYAEQSSRCNDRFLYRALKLCNTCDLNYRTSRNRRLLVEITLIQVAQADEDPVAGRPATILKPIFGQTAPVEQSAHTAESKTASDSSHTKDSPTPSPQQQPGTAGETMIVSSTDQQREPGGVKSPSSLTQPAPPARPTLKRGSFGTSITAPFRKQEEAAPQMAEETQVEPITERMPWNSDTLRQCWLQFAASLPEEDLIMAGRMRGIEPTMGSGHSFNITIDNGKLLNEWQSIAKPLQRFLCQRTSLPDITMNVIVNEQEHQVAMTRSEQFADMAKRNPVLLKLKDNLQLDFA